MIDGVLLFTISRGECAMKKKFVAIYVRVSSTRQETRSQEPELKRWADAQELPVRWYRDKCTGKSMNRPAWNKLQEAIDSGCVSTVVVWRCDRLGRTAQGLTTLFSELRRMKVNLQSLRDGINLDTAAGRMLANVLASLSQWENEVRGERIAAGLAAVRAAGKTWKPGSKKGVRKVVTELQIKAIKQMKKDGETIRDISRAVKLSRPTIYSVLSA